MGPEGLRALMKTKGIRVTRAKAALIVATAERALLLPEAERKARRRALQADLVVYDKIRTEILKAETELAAVIDDNILRSLSDSRRLQQSYTCRKPAET
jgi:hypothetical protein